MSFGSTFDLNNLDGANGFKIPDLTTGDDLGRSLSSAGDFNGDGIDDLIIGTIFSPYGYAVFGSDNIEPRRFSRYCRFGWGQRFSLL